MVSMDTYAVAKGLSEAHRENIAERDKAIAEWKAYAKRLEHELALWKAQAAGLAAYLGEFRRAHPQSPVLSDSGKRYNSGERKGTVKSKGRIAFEAAFDNKARELGIRNPAATRDD